MISKQIPILVRHVLICTDDTAKGKKVTFFPSPSPYYSEKIASAFAIGDPSVKFVASGYPRNDKLFHYTK